ncbi:hypothetical protein CAUPRSCDRAFT_10372 [Caulochytrium protostelioides]|uniref:Uncharacterized protein n=1 Tax=Caulochytrium protostelioides TaxID=1555241 RepID=A0A4P9WZH6_9FUNG|nr:hypothetical protein CAUPRSCDRAFT_10372 [Caulochytrium protostelioides]
MAHREGRRHGRTSPINRNAHARATAAWVVWGLTSGASPVQAWLALPGRPLARGGASTRAVAPSRRSLTGADRTHAHLGQDVGRWSFVLIGCNSAHRVSQEPSRPSARSARDWPVGLRAELASVARRLPFPCSHETTTRCDDGEF